MKGTSTAALITNNYCLTSFEERENHKERRWQLKNEERVSLFNCKYPLLYIFTAVYCVITGTYCYLIRFSFCFSFFKKYSLTTKYFQHSTFRFYFTVSVSLLKPNSRAGEWCAESFFKALIDSYF